MSASISQILGKTLRLGVSMSVILVTVGAGAWMFGLSFDHFLPQGKQTGNVILVSSPFGEFPDTDPPPAEAATGSRSDCRPVEGNQALVICSEPLSTLGRILQWATLTGVLVAIVGTLFTALQRSVPAATTDSIARWLKGVDPRPAFNRFASALRSGIDWGLGRRILSPRSVALSVAGSLIAMLGIFLLRAGHFGLFALEGEFGRVYRIFFSNLRGSQETYMAGTWSSSEALPMIRRIAVVLGFFPGIMAVTVTRMTVRLAESQKSVSRLVILAVSCVLLTAVGWIAIYWIYSSVGADTQTPFWLRDLVALFQLDDPLPALPAIVRGEHLGGVFFYSTFVPSIWLFLFIVSVILLKVGVVLSQMIEGARTYVFDLDRPWASLRTVGILLVILGCTVGALMTWPAP